MIAKLKKFTFLVYHREYKELLTTLRDAGVVHIIEKGKSQEEQQTGDSMTVLLKRYDNAVRELSRRIPEDSAIAAIPDDSPAAESIISQLEEMNSVIEEHKNRISVLRNEAAKSEPWGEYDIAGFRKLEDEGYAISLFTCPAKRFTDELFTGYSVVEINQVRGRVYFAVVHKPGEAIDIDADPEKLGDRSAPQLRREIDLVAKSLADTEELITKSAPEWLATVKKGRIDLINRIEYSIAETQARIEAEGRLVILQGWVPAEAEEKLKEAVAGSEFYYYESEADEGENIPVLLRNNSFSKLFEPISKLFALPDYRELDLTPFFAPFFMLFFGFCLGDAGYGLLFIALGFIMYNRVPVKFRPFLSLAKYLGVATVVFGVISGTFFGMNLIDSGYTITDSSITMMKSEKIPADAILKLESIKGERFGTRKEYMDAVGNAAGPELIVTHKTALLKSAEGDFSLLRSFRHLMQDSISMFYLAIIIGALQIIFGMVVKIINITIQRGFKHSLSTVGWVLLILTLIVFKGGAAAGIMDAEATKPVFLVFAGISGVLIFLLNNLTINVFFRIGSGVWDTYNIATSVFGDLLSYIRLFALGISSAILGFVFNDISSQFLSIPYIGWIFFVLLLVVGHGINIFMAALGGFIHPMRLTFVEFYKNAGFKGGGKEYKPFRINS
jgi:V/A-type H+/Na+-transporting ATPase subunit I